MSMMPNLGGLTPTSGLTAGGGAGAAAGGMNPLLLPLLLSFGPAMAGKFFGDPMEKLRRQILSLLTPQMIAKMTQQFYQQAISSPAYSNALGTIATGANATANTVGANLAARGLGTTGTGAVLSGLTPSLVGSQTSGLRAGAYESSRQQALDTISKQIDALYKTSGPSQTQQLFSGGLSAFSPYLESYLRSHYPSLIPARP